MKKILIPSAILLALTIGGVTMATQPNKPIKQDSQLMITNTESQTVGTDPAATVTPMSATASSTASPATPPVSSVPTPTPTTTPDTTPSKAPSTPPANPQPTQETATPPVDTTKPGTYNQQSQTVTY